MSRDSAGRRAEPSIGAGLAEQALAVLAAMFEYDRHGVSIRRASMCSKQAALRSERVALFERKFVD
jgi:hypothetical protein